MSCCRVHRQLDDASEGVDVASDVVATEPLSGAAANQLGTNSRVGYKPGQCIPLDICVVVEGKSGDTATSPTVGSFEDQHFACYACPLLCGDKESAVPTTDDDWSNVHGHDATWLCALHIANKCNHCLCGTVCDDHGCVHYTWPSSDGESHFGSCPLSSGKAIGQNKGEEQDVLAW